MSEETTWLRLQLGRAAHKVLKLKADRENKGIADFASLLLTDAAFGRVSLGNLAVDTPIEGRCPSRLPLAQYAAEASELMIVGTTLTDLVDSLDDFLIPKAKSGTKITLLRVDERVLRDNPDVLSQIAFHYGHDRDAALEAFANAGKRLWEFQRDYPSSVTLRRLPTYPTYGLTIVDPFSDSRKLRVALYPYKDVLSCQITLHIEPTTSESKEIFDLFLGNYHRFLVSSIDYQ